MFLPHKATPKATLLSNVTMADGDLDKDPIPIDTAMDTEPEDEPQHDPEANLTLKRPSPFLLFPSMI
jgi:hypothetical protein